MKIEEEVTEHKAQETSLTGFARFRQSQDLFFLRSDIGDPAQTLVRSSVIVGMEKLSDAGVGRFLLNKVLRYDSWFEVFDRFSLSIWKKEESIHFLLALPWAKAGFFSRFFESHELSTGSSSQGWVAKQWNTAQIVYLKKAGPYLLIADSKDRILPPLDQPTPDDSKFLVAKSSFLARLDLEGSAWIKSIDGIEVAQSQVQLIATPKDGVTLAGWMDILKASEMPFSRNELDIARLNLRISGLLQNKDFQNRILSKTSKRLPALDDLISALAGQFTIHGFRIDGRTHGSATAMFASPGASAQAIQQIEGLLQRRGGVLTDLEESRKYSVSIPFLPISLFLSRKLSRLNLSTYSDWGGVEPRDFGDPGFFHLAVSLNQISPEIRKGIERIKEQFHVRKLRQCLQIRRMETGSFLTCPLGDSFQSTEAGLDCPLHGSTNSPGSRIAREGDTRFHILEDFLQKYAEIYLRARVGEEKIILSILDRIPTEAKPAHSGGS